MTSQVSHSLAARLVKFIHASSNLLPIYQMLTFLWIFTASCKGTHLNHCLFKRLNLSVYLIPTVCDDYCSNIGLVRISLVEKLFELVHEPVGLVATILGEQFS